MLISLQTLLPWTALGLRSVFEAALADLLLVTSLTPLLLRTCVKAERDRETLVPLLQTAKETKAKLEGDTRFNDLAARLAGAEKVSNDAQQAREKASGEVGLQKEAVSNAQTALAITLAEVPEERRNVSTLTQEFLMPRTEHSRLEQENTSAIEAEKAAGLRLASAKEGQRNAGTNLSKLETAAMQAEEEFSKSLEASKLSEEDYQSGKSDVTNLEALEAAIQAHTSQIVANKDRVARLIEETGGQDRPDIDALKAVANACTVELENGRSEQARLASELDRKKAVFAVVTTLSTKIARLEEQYAPLGEIAGLVNGDKDLKVRLPEIAIAAMLMKYWMHPINVLARWPITASNFIAQLRQRVDSPNVDSISQYLTPTLRISVDQQPVRRRRISGLISACFGVVGCGSAEQRWHQA